MTEFQCFLDFNDCGRYHIFISREHSVFIPSIASVLNQSQHCSKVNLSKGQLIAIGRFSVIILTMKLTKKFHGFLPQLLYSYVKQPLPNHIKCLFSKLYFVLNRPRAEILKIVSLLFFGRHQKGLLKLKDLHPAPEQKPNVRTFNLQSHLRLFGKH